MKGSRSPYQSTTNAEMPIVLAWLICLRIAVGSCDEYPAEVTAICLGCPNHASYSARTSGDFPVALYFKRTGASDSTPGHPWDRTRSKSRAALASRDIRYFLEAANPCLGCHGGVQYVAELSNS